MVGCRLNQAELEQLAMELMAQGQEIVADSAEADCVIINTCCVTAKACADSRKMIRHYQRETQAQVITTGCWTSAFPEEAFQIAGQGQVFVNSEKNQILNKLKKSEADCIEGRLEGIKPDLGNRSRTRSFIKAQEGCNNACTYCLTRIARGKSISVPADQVIEQIHQDEELGVKEIVLTGVQLGSWGKDLEGDLRIADLIESVLRKTRVPRIRISSIEPWDVDECLLDCFVDERFCPHLHLPLQSGSDATLRRMARPIDTSQYGVLIEKINRVHPEIAITTDIMVGFPGETKEIFEDSLQFIEKMNFSGGHVFRFSPMPGTLAAKFSDKVPVEICQERSERVRSLLEEGKRKGQQSKVGTMTAVLWEHGKNQKGKFVYSGLTPDYFRVYTQSKIDLTNTITQTQIVGIKYDGILFGEVIG